MPHRGRGHPMIRGDQQRRPAQPRNQDEIRTHRPGRILTGGATGRHMASSRPTQDKLRGRRPQQLTHLQQDLLLVPGQVSQFLGSAYRRPHDRHAMTNPYLHTPEAALADRRRACPASRNNATAGYLPVGEGGPDLAHLGKTCGVQESMTPLRTILLYRG